MLWFVCFDDLFCGCFVVLVTVGLVRLAVCVLLSEWLTPVVWVSVVVWIVVCCFGVGLALIAGGLFVCDLVVLLFVICFDLCLIGLWLADLVCCRAIGFDFWFLVCLSLETVW